MKTVADIMWTIKGFNTYADHFHVYSSTTDQPPLTLSLGCYPAGLLGLN